MGKFAAQTSVSTEKTRAEIESTLAKYGADAFAYATGPARAQIEFIARGRRVRFVLPLPDRNDKKYSWTPGGRKLRDMDARLAAWEQDCRQKWRALLLAIKAKLEAVECGIAEFEDEFLANIVLPSGETAGHWLRPQIARAYETNEMPLLLTAN